MTLPSPRLQQEDEERIDIEGLDELFGDNGEEPPPDEDTDTALQQVLGALTTRWLNGEIDFDTFEAVSQRLRQDVFIGQTGNIELLDRFLTGGGLDEFILDTQTEAAAAAPARAETKRQRDLNDLRTRFNNDYESILNPIRVLATVAGGLTQDGQAEARVLLQGLQATRDQNFQDFLVAYSTLAAGPLSPQQALNLLVMYPAIYLQSSTPVILADAGFDVENFDLSTFGVSTDEQVRASISATVTARTAEATRRETFQSIYRSIKADVRIPSLNPAEDASRRKILRRLLATLEEQEQRLEDEFAVRLDVSDPVTLINERLGFAPVQALVGSGLKGGVFEGFTGDVIGDIGNILRSTTPEQIAREEKADVEEVAETERLTQEAAEESRLGALRDEQGTLIDQRIAQLTARINSGDFSEEEMNQARAEIERLTTEGEAAGREFGALTTGATAQEFFGERFGTPTPSSDFIGGVELQRRDILAPEEATTIGRSVEEAFAVFRENLQTLRGPGFDFDKDTALPTLEDFNRAVVNRGGSVNTALAEEQRALFDKFLPELVEGADPIGGPVTPTPNVGRPGPVRRRPRRTA